MKENKQYRAIELGKDGQPIPGTETTLWHSRSMATTCIIMAKEGKHTFFLVEKRGPGCPDNIGKYVFPCGYLSWDETLKQAAIREVYEETGLPLNENNLEFIGYEDKVTANRQNVTMRFLAKVPVSILEEGLFTGLINPNTAKRGGEEGECESLHLVDINWIRDHASEFAFGHEYLAEEAYRLG